MQSIQNRIVNEARLWIGTKFKHQGRVKGKGVDCLGLLMGVAETLEIKSKTGEPFKNFDVLDYSRTPDGNKMKRELEKHLHMVADFAKITHIKPSYKAVLIQAGDILLINFDGNPQHLAIANGEGGIIHSYAKAGRVVETTLDDDTLSQLEGVYQVDFCNL